MQKILMQKIQGTNHEEYSTIEEDNTKDTFLPLSINYSLIYIFLELGVLM